MSTSTWHQSTEPAERGSSSSPATNPTRNGGGNNMSLKPDQKLIVHYSAEDWTRTAIGSEKQLGEEGFKNLSHHDWNHHWHYQQINKIRPEFSGSKALEEMADYRLRHVEYLMRVAAELDAGIERLARMDWEINEVVKYKEEE